MTMSCATQLKKFIVLNVILFIIGINADNRRIIPTYVEVREGEDIQVRLVETFEDEISCYVKTPRQVNCNLKLADEKDTGCDERIHYWSINGTCGFYITNVRKEDSGFWRLTSQNNKEKRMVDAVQIEVIDKFQNKIEKVEIVKGHSYKLSFDNGKTAETEEYCVIQNPHDQNKTIWDFGCHTDYINITATHHGNWSAIVSVTGQIEEVRKVRDVSVFQEYLDYGYTVSSNPEALHLFCNVNSENKMINMCRFTKGDINQMGLRLKDGLRKGRYAYYGNGLAKGECGLTIESPEEKDYGYWYCMISAGIQFRPYGATIQILKPTDQITENAMAPPLSTAVSSVITTKGNILKIECSSNVPLSYCRFLQPNKEIVTSQAALYSVRQHTDTSSSNYEKMLPLGSCMITIAAKKEHNGTWTCYMGPTSLGMELSQQIVVRIAETSLAAVDKYVFNMENDMVILQCKTVPDIMELAYCRFLSPDGFGININERITKNNPIERNGKRYWYNGKGLAAGDCGLVIEQPSSIDNGNWTCAAKLESKPELEQMLQNDINEEFDTIYFAYEPTSSESILQLTAGAATGIGFAVITILVALGFLVIVGKKKWQNRQPNQDADTSRSCQEFISLNTISTNSNINSRSGSNSGDNSTTNSQTGSVRNCTIDNKSSSSSSNSSNNSSDNSNVILDLTGTSY